MAELKSIPHNIWIFLRGKKFVFINILAAAGIIFLIMFSVYKYLDAYTKHGETITVPDLRGMTSEKLSDFLVDKHLKFIIIDSVFLAKKPKGIVVEQDPLPNEKVKENRTIYITINKLVAPAVKFPSLEDYSYPYVTAFLETYGLKVGDLIYKPDLAKNRVLAARYKGREIRAGDMIPKGSEIGLTLGDGLGNTKVTIPSLVGLPLDEALFVLKASSLNKGAVISDSPISDTAAFRVYKQKPDPATSARISQGESVDIFVTQNLSKIPKK